MSNYINAHCKICGKGYHVCASCSEQKSFPAWRSVTDTPAHFQIYLTLHGYTLSKNREKAQSQLKQCNLSGLENFYPEIQSAIREIMAEPQTRAAFPQSD
ncbi:MAG: hypothetical protein HFH37_10240 [Lachnospiraceae bacterium]|jgi:hypothetical protein|nr:hypothetical protein [Lachnospiraceae bacterium]